jgi:hypothetical protein
MISAPELSVNARFMLKLAAPDDADFISGNRVAVESWDVNVVSR